MFRMHLHTLYALLIVSLSRATTTTTTTTIITNDASFKFNNYLNSRDFRSVPTTVKTYENDTVLLPCDYKIPYGSVRWLKDDLLIVDAPHSEEVSLKHYRLLINGSLVVMDVQTEDTGKYLCEIISGTITVGQFHFIEVQYAPRIYATPRGFIELPLGAVLEIICEAQGVPRPAVTWTHNNKTVIDYLVGNRQSYIVEIQSRKMAGVITCLANNGVGQPASDSIELSVMFVPEVHATQKVFYSKVGARVQLECLVESAPLAKVRWLHDGRTITFNSHHYARQDIEIPFNGSIVVRYYSDMKHVFIIKNVRDSDMGMYECRAENSIGVWSAYMELTFRPMPCTFKVSPDKQSPTSHLLVWQTESYSPVIEFKLKFRQVPSEVLVLSPTTMVSKSDWTELTIPADLSIGPIYTTSFTLYGLHPASIYQVVVFARNYYGWSDSSKILRFATGGEVEFPNYSTETDTYDGDAADGDNDAATFNKKKSIHDNRGGVHNVHNSGNNHAFGVDSNSIAESTELSLFNNEINDTSIDAQHMDKNLLYSSLYVVSSSSTITITPVTATKHIFSSCKYFTNHLSLFNFITIISSVNALMNNFYC